MKPLTLNAFIELEREDKSLYIRAIFEQAAICACKYDSADYEALCERLFDGVKNKQTCALVYNPETKSYLFVGDESTLSILTLYNETLFDSKNRFELSENVFATTIIADIIFRYTTSSVAKKLPGIEFFLENSSWRTNPNALMYKSGEPLLAFRTLGYYGETLIDSKLVTPAYLGCDANTVITEQLVNFKHFNQDPNLDFSDSEGRGAFFCYKGIPFHRYNSNRGNDQLCQYMGLLSIDDSKHLWLIKKLPKGSMVSSNFHEEFPSYTGFPSIASRLESVDYHVVLMMPLYRYIHFSLQHQRSLSVSDRIKNEADKQASDIELDEVLLEMDKYISSDIAIDAEQNVVSMSSVSSNHLYKK